MSRIKIEEKDMLISAKKIESELKNLKTIQAELNSILNSTSWNMKSKGNIENKFNDAKKLNNEITLILERMSNNVKLSVDSIKEQDKLLSNMMLGQSVVVAGTLNKLNKAEQNNSGWTQHVGSFKNELGIGKYEGSIGYVDGKYSNGIVSAGYGIDVFQGEYDNFLGYQKNEKRVGALTSAGVSVVDVGLEGGIGNKYIGAGLEANGAINTAEATLGAYVDLDDKKLYAGGDVGIYAAKGDVSAEFEFLWFEVELGAYGAIGAGASAFVSVKDNQLKANLGATPGIGGGLWASIGIKD